eukprot:TRINITY_DN74774_c0_g1_i1.p1 TRINITY_DN74774_c0_g1~~TRINITY_DN74774_c0_g1_i1.p1  ORF type:complete len:233 (+),score=26.20 TRINITY_DN74774_c0_g1_i1:23-721(+)
MGAEEKTPILQKKPCGKCFKSNSAVIMMSCGHYLCQTCKAKAAELSACPVPGCNCTIQLNETSNQTVSDSPRRNRPNRTACTMLLAFPFATLLLAIGLGLAIAGGNFTSNWRKMYYDPWFNQNLCNTTCVQHVFAHGKMAMECQPPVLNGGCCKESGNYAQHCMGEYPGKKNARAFWLPLGWGLGVLGACLMFILGALLIIIGRSERWGQYPKEEDASEYDFHKFDKIKRGR